MLCPRAQLVEEFVAGNLAEELVPDFEQHIEECAECFLRVTCAASEASREARAALGAAISRSSRLERFLTETRLAETLDEEREILSTPEEVGKTIGPWTLFGILGIGGMGVVYRSRHGLSGREAALKTVKKPVIASAVSRLRQEIELLERWRHPGIVSLLDSDPAADEPWYAMELFEGPTLREFNRRAWSTVRLERTPGRKRIAGGNLEAVLRLFAALCEPLDFIHRSGMVHGDIKPSNVFLREGDAPVLMDFGLASLVRGTVGREALVVTGRPRGSLPYIAPEIIRGQIPDSRADLYALGCMLYESLTGFPPFLALSGFKIVDMHLQMAPEPPSQAFADMPLELEELVLRLLAKDPQERIGHASALKSSLESIVRRLTANGTRVSVPRAVQPVPLFRAPMVGRDAELAAGLSLVERAHQTSSGALILVSGESGIGKTFFTTEIAQRAALVGMQVITGDCIPLTPTTDGAADASTTPLYALRGFFEMLREHCIERGPAEVERVFDERLLLLSHYAPALSNLLLPELQGVSPAQLPAAAARERIVSAVVDTIVTYARLRPLLLALDDLQWADDLTLAVLERLDEDTFAKLPLVVIANYRSDEAPEAVRSLARKPFSHDLSLGRLRGLDIGALVGGMLAMASPPESLVSYVNAHSEGIPFFAAEYLRSLVSTGALVYEEGAWSTGARTLEEIGSTSGELPRTLQELIRGRLERLAPDVVLLLEGGAVFGRQFSVDLLQRMFGREGEELAPLLEAACATQVTSSEDSRTYTFLHDKIRETLYGSLPRARRAELHLAAARALNWGEATPPNEFGPLAYHYRQGGDLPRALDFLEKAGAHALALAAYADADRFLSEALELEARLPERQPSLRRARWLRQRGDALGGLGRMNESSVALKASAELLGRPYPSSKRGLARSLFREVMTQVRHRLLQNGVQRLSAEQRELNTEVMNVAERLHEVSYFLGNDADLILSTTLSLNSSERGGATPSLAIAYSNAAMMAGVLPIPSLAEHYFRLASAAIHATPDLTAESWLLEMEGHYRGWQGQRDKAIDYLERAIVLARKGGFFRRSDEAECVRIGLDIVAGHHEAVIERTAGVERNARKRHDVQVQIWAVLQRAEARLISGAFDAARGELAGVTSVLPSLGKPERLWATGLEAYLRLRTGRESSARDYLERGIRLVTGGPPVHSYCVGACDRLVQTAIELAQSEAGAPLRRNANELAEKACAVVERAARVFPNARPAAALHRGSLELARGRKPTEAVIERWRRAVAVSQTLALPYQELRLRTALLEHAHTPAQEDEQRVKELRTRLQIDATTPI